MRKRIFKIFVDYGSKIFIKNIKFIIFFLYNKIKFYLSLKFVLFIVCCNINNSEYYKIRIYEIFLFY